MTTWMHSMKRRACLYVLVSTREKEKYIFKKKKNICWSTLENGWGWKCKWYTFSTHEKNIWDDDQQNSVLKFLRPCYSCIFPLLIHVVASHYNFFLQLLTVTTHNINGECSKKLFCNSPTFMREFFCCILMQFENFTWVHLKENDLV